MNQSELAQKMLEWETLVHELDELGKEIEDAVLELGKTVDAGNVRASYSGGRKKFNYEKAGWDARYAHIQRYTTTHQKTNWKKVCEAAGYEMEDIPFTQSEPTVTLKLKEIK